MYPSSIPLRSALLCLTAVVMTGGIAAAELSVSPAAVILDRPEATQQILIHRTDASGRQIDVTRSAHIEIKPSGFATVDDRGLISPIANGTGEITIQVNDQQAIIPITVIRMQDPVPVSFRHEVIPILTKTRCNSGGCHGKAEGQNGFKLSIFGFDARADYEAIAMEGRGRRVSPAHPDRSLLFQKASARVPHGGAEAIVPDSYRDRLLLRWIAEGTQFDSVADNESAIVGIEIQPQQQVLLAGESQQIRVSSIDAAGRRRCVTNDSEFESNAVAISDVDSRGLIQASEVPGEAAILVRHLGHVATCRITLPRPGVTMDRPAENNFIDTLAWNKLQRLGIPPSDLCDDATFLRRASLDTIGTLPTAEEVRQFLADPATDKRSRLVDRLLDRDEYADYWAMIWLDILRADQLTISPQGAVAMQRWLRDSFAQNRPFTELATDLLTVQGNTSSHGPGSFYKILNKPDEASQAISQLLMGVRIECAQCHHHPSERWSQEDYVGLAGFFTGLTLKKLPGGEQAVVSFGGTDLPHPRSDQIVPARALGAADADFSQTTDRRRVLADWLTSPENPFFAKAIANRIWAHYFGRGLIEPIDDIRETNPATNPALMEALAGHMRDVNYDLKAFTRTLLTSRLYQLSSSSLTANADDEQNFSHYLQKSLPAEVLLDAISQSTGVYEHFNGWPTGYRAIQVWDNHIPSYFFRIFGRPVRATVCQCERSDDPSIAQALHLLNAPELFDKISDRQGHARQLAQSQMSPSEIIEQLYLTTLSRLPTAAEQQLMQQAFGATDADINASRRAATEDILWALLNSKEFVFNH